MTPLDWITTEDMVSSSHGLYVVVGACRARRYRKRWVAALRNDNGLVLHGDAATTVASAIDSLRAEFLQRVRAGWWP